MTFQKLYNLAPTYLSSFIYRESFSGKKERRWSHSVVSDSLWPHRLYPTGCTPPGFSIHGIFQARVLDWAAISFSGGSFWPRDQTRVFRITGRRFTIWTTREAQILRIPGSSHAGPLACPKTQWWRYNRLPLSTSLSICILQNLEN